MEFSYQQQEDSKSSSEETDRSSEPNDDTGTGRSYECVFCKRGFTTAQALGGHMNIHRKDRANNKAKQNFHPSGSSKVDDIENYADLGFCSPSPSHHVAGGNHYSHDQVDTNNYYRQIYFPSPPQFGVRPNPHVQYSEVHQGQQFGSQDWRQRNLSLYTNPLCVRENKDKIQGNSEENGLDLELRLGHHP